MFRRVVNIISVAILIGVVAFFSLCCYLYFNGYMYGRVTISGDISPQLYLQVRKWLINSNVPDRTVVIDSGGGDPIAAIAIGKLIHQYGWNVRIENHCYSSCANYIFPAGKAKHVTKTAMLLFHGDPHQVNFGKQVEATVWQMTGKHSKNTVSIGVKGKEWVFDLTSGDDKGRRELQAFLSIPETFHGAKEFVDFMISLSDGFYRELGINPMIGSYGQTGKYKETYESYKYNGFTYSLDSLEKLGVGNIQLADGEWHPELNPDYKVTYEVAYP